MERQIRDEEPTGPRDGPCYCPVCDVTPITAILAIEQNMEVSHRQHRSEASSRLFDHLTVGSGERVRNQGTLQLARAASQDHQHSVADAELQQVLRLLWVTGDS
jgi:hypothetical protein